MAGKLSRRALMWLLKAPYKAVATRGGRMTTLGLAGVGGGVYGFQKLRSRVIQPIEDPLSYREMRQARANSRLLQSLNQRLPSPPPRRPVMPQY